MESKWYYHGTDPQDWDDGLQEGKTQEAKIKAMNVLIAIEKKLLG
jgi:hypothetical protein